MSQGALVEAINALVRVLSERAQAGGHVSLRVDRGPLRKPHWRVVADGVVVAASQQWLVGREDRTPVG